jgi:hypothetical protein
LWGHAHWSLTAHWLTCRLVDPAKAAAALPPLPLPPPPPHEFKAMSQAARAAAVQERLRAVEARQAAAVKLRARDQPPVSAFARSLDLDSAVAAVAFTYAPLPTAAAAAAATAAAAALAASAASAASGQAGGSGRSSEEDPPGLQDEGPPGWVHLHAREAFASYPDGVVAQRLSCTVADRRPNGSLAERRAAGAPHGGAGCLHFALEWERDAAGKNAAMNAGGLQSTLQPAPWATRTSWLATLANGGSSGGGGALAWHVCALVTVDGGGGGGGYAATSAATVQAVPATGQDRKTAVLDVRNARDATVLVAAATSYRHKDPARTCAATLERASAFGWGQLKARHVQDHRKLFRAVR